VKHGSEVHHEHTHMLRVKYFMSVNDWNMATIRICEVMFDKYNVYRICILMFFFTKMD
jgi:hypothetical protein